MFYIIPEEDLNDFLKQYKTDDEEPQEYELYSQRDPRWKNKKLGFSKTSTIGMYGCYITALGILSHHRPDVVNDLFKENNLFIGDLLKRDKESLNKMAKLLDIKFDRIEYDGYYKPDYDTIKEVRMNRAQHFVVRVYNNGNPYIIDPWDGKKKGNYTYPFRSYRLFKKK